MKTTDGKITLSSPEQKLSDRKKALPLPEQKSIYLFQPPQKRTHPLLKKKLFDNSFTPNQNSYDEKNTPSLLEQESSGNLSSPEQNPSDKRNGSSSPKQMFPDGRLSLFSHSNGLIYRNTPYNIKVVAM